MAGRPGNEAGSTLCDYKLTNIYILQSKDFPGWSLASQDDKIWLGFLVGSRANLWDIKIMPQALTVANTTATMPFFVFFLIQGSMFDPIPSPYLLPPTLRVTISQWSRGVVLACEGASIFPAVSGTWSWPLIPVGAEGTELSLLMPKAYLC